MVTRMICLGRFVGGERRKVQSQCVRSTVGPGRVRSLLVVGKRRATFVKERLLRF
jgi:hypothetical protein